MLLKSTVRNFVEDVPEAQRDAFLSAVDSVTVTNVRLTAHDKIGTLLNGETMLAVVDEGELSRVLDGKGFPSTIVSDIRRRMMMITPVGERDAFLRYVDRVKPS